MKALIIILLIIYTFQMCALLSTLGHYFLKQLSIYYFSQPEDKCIQSKLDFLKFFIPFFWFIPMVNMILKWWHKLN